MHFSFLVAVIAFLLSFFKLAILAMSTSVLAAIWYFGMRFDFRNPFKSLLFSGIRYIADGAYVLGGFIGGVKEGMIYLEATRTRKQT
jgi:hypothetical protein